MKFSNKFIRTEDIQHHRPKRVLVLMDGARNIFRVMIILKSLNLWESREEQTGGWTHFGGSHWSRTHPGFRTRCCSYGNNKAKQLWSWRSVAQNSSAQRPLHFLITLWTELGQQIWFTWYFI